MSKKFRIAKRISMEDIDHFEDVEVDDDFVDNEMVQIIADNEYDPMYDDCESIAVALQLAGYGKVADLEAKLAESEKEKDYYQDLYFRGVKGQEKLKQQLAEKEKEIEKYKEICTISNLEKLQVENMLLKRKSNQDKISFAVEQLEKVRSFAYNTFKEFGCFDETDLEHILDNQIEELKKEMN